MTKSIAKNKDNVYWEEDDDLLIKIKFRIPFVSLFLSCVIKRVKSVVFKKKKR
jgi:hypothetical protein